MAEELAAVAAEHGIELAQEQLALLERYCARLWEWNAKVNLTRHTDYQKFVARDLVDSLAFAEFLGPGEKILDVGTGGGVPGVVLAVLRPDLDVSLSESVGKRARAVADIVEQLRLDVPVYGARAEELLGQWTGNTLVARAVARLAKLLGWLRPHWSAFDRLLVVKGPAWVEERGEARHQGLLGKLALRKLTSYPLPGADSESVLLQICPKKRMIDATRCQIRDLSQEPPSPNRRRRKRGKKASSASAGVEGRAMSEKGKRGKGKKLP
jgi:16S rRNA (guanine527-N7)-methyltransferase